jgi:glycosyltransferase involved in cell wall biosynthesis
LASAHLPEASFIDNVIISQKMTENKAKTKVLYVITKSNWGGAQRYVFDLATNLPPDQFDVSVALGGEGRLKEKLDIAKIKIMPIPGMQRDISLFKELRAFFFLLKVFKETRPDVVHLNSSKAGGLGALAARLAGIRHIIFTVHGWPFNEDQGIFGKWSVWTLSWLTSLLTTDVIVLAAEELRQGQSMIFTGKKIHLIRNGVTTETLLSRDEARKQLLPDNQNKLWVGTIAELHPNKGLPYLIDAAKLLPSVTFCVIGEGEKRTEFENAVEKLGLGGRFFMPGFREEACRYLSAFDIFVLPSIKEGLPYAILEAGLAKLPTVATAIGGIQDIITDGVSGLIVPPKDPGALAEAIQLLIQDEGLRTRLAENLQKKIETEFSMKEMLAKTLALYKRP